MRGPGRLIAFEGIDGCGKTTQAALLAAAIGEDPTHEPGATPLGLRLRELVLGLEPGLPPVCRQAETLLLAADRAQHVAEIVAPAMAEGRWVVTDRFSASTLAYQGYGRGMDLDVLRRLTTWAARGLEPDLTVLVDLEPARARERIRAGHADRLEQLDDAFFERVRRGYLALAADGGDRWVVVDGSQPVDAVGEAVRAAVHARLGAPPNGWRT